MSDTPSDTLADAVEHMAQSRMLHASLALRRRITDMVMSADDDAASVPDIEIGEMISATIAYVAARKARAASRAATAKKP